MCLKQHNKPAFTQIFIWWNHSKQATTEREHDGNWNIIVFILYQMLHWHLWEELVFSVATYATLFYEDLARICPWKPQVDVLVIAESTNKKKKEILPPKNRPKMPS